MTPDYRERSSGEVASFLERQEHLLHLAPTNLPASERVAALEEHVLLYRKPDPNSGTHHLSFRFCDIGGFNGALPLIMAALDDPRVSDVSFRVGGVGKISLLESDFGVQLTRINPAGMPIAFKESLLSDDSIVKTPVSAVVCSLAAFRGPEHSAIFAAKAVFGAKTIALISESWCPFDGLFAEAASHPESAKIDLILCNDEVAQSILQHSLPALPAEKMPQIVATGTGVNLFRPSRSREEIRGILGIPSGASVALLLGSYDYRPEQVEGASATSQLLATLKTLDAAADGMKVHVLIRPHPSDAGQESLRALVGSMELKNVTSSWAPRGIVTMDDAQLVADHVISLESTETFRAGVRGAFAGGGREEGYREAIRALDIPVLDSVTKMRTSLRRAVCLPETPAAEESSSSIGQRMLDALLSV